MVRLFSGILQRPDPAVDGDRGDLHQLVQTRVLHDPAGAGADPQILLRGEVSTPGEHRQHGPAPQLSQLVGVSQAVIGFTGRKAPETQRGADKASVRLGLVTEPHCVRITHNLRGYSCCEMITTGTVRLGERPITVLSWYSVQ